MSDDPSTTPDGIDDTTARELLAQLITQVHQTRETVEATRESAHRAEAAAQRTHGAVEALTQAVTHVVDQVGALTEALRRESDERASADDGLREGLRRTNTRLREVRSNGNGSSDQ